MNVLNLTGELERLVADVVARMEEFGHIDPTRLLVCVAATRGSGVHGTYAKIHPLRFAGGATSARMKRGRRAVTCTLPTITHGEREILYLVYFLAPRFFNLSQREKLITVFHELYHVSPAFDGDIRRFAGRNYAHGSSTRQYNAHMATLVDAYLTLRGDAPLPDFLSATMGELRSRYHVIVARRMQAPRMEISTAR